MKVSVITITRNNFEELEQTLASLKDVSGIESVVINGGTCEKTRELLKNHSGITLTEADEGISDAFNKGLKLSTADTIAYLNSGDVLIDPHYYSWAGRELEQNETASLVCSDIEFDDQKRGKRIMKPRFLSLKTIGSGMPYPHPSMVIRKKIFDQIGLFSKNYKIAMDFDLMVRAEKLKLKEIYYPHATISMDGKGVSSANEYKGLLECKRSLIENGFFRGKVKFDYYERIARSLIRRIIF